MATNPLSAFLSNFQSATSRSGVDPIREQAMVQDAREFEAERPMRQAQTDYYTQQAQGQRLENQEDLLERSRQQYAQAEMRANELGGVRNALDDEVFMTRAAEAINTRNQALGDTSGRQFAGVERINRSNLDQWGMGQGVYDDILTGQNPSHQRGTDDDELLVPLYRDADGNVGPRDMDDGGGVETWSANQAERFLREQFVGSDEYGAALEGMHTGGGGAGGGSRPPAPGGGQPAPGGGQGSLPLANPAEGNPAQQVTPDAMVAAGQVAPREGEVDIVSTPPEQAGGATPPGDRQGQARDQQQRMQGGTIAPEAMASSTELNLPADRQDPQNAERLNRHFRRYFGEAGERAVRGLPATEGESEETAFGVPRNSLTEDAPRSARRVVEGKGISPQQAKELAGDKERLPEPSVRAAVAAGAQFLDGLEPAEGGGQGQPSSGRSGGGSGGNREANIGATTGGYNVSGGKRPTHKQLTTAVTLNRAGLLDDEALTRYADMGVVSSDGVDTIQTGMQESAANLRQEMQNATDLQQTRIQEQAAMDRTLVGIQGDIAQDQAEREAEANEPLSFEETREQGNQTAQAHLEAQGMEREQAEELGRQYGARLASMATNSEGLRQSEFDMGQLTGAMIELDEYSRRYNEAPQGVGRGLIQSGVRRFMGREQSLDLGDNPLAVTLTAEGSNVAQVDDPNMFERQVNVGEEPTLIRAIQEPMIDTAREMGAMGTVQDNPDLQYEIYDVARERLQGLAAEQEDRSILNDETAIQDAVMQATRSILGQGG